MYMHGLVCSWFGCARWHTFALVCMLQHTLNTNTARAIGLASARAHVVVIVVVVVVVCDALEFGKRSGVYA
jgi:hypothetical protein